MNAKPAAMAFLFGGLLPVVAFTVIEAKYGPVWGIIAGLVFGGGEVIWELATTRRVSGLTLGGNGLLFVLGGISLMADEGIWFKLQPAIMEAVMAAVLIGTWIAGRPLLTMLAEKQNITLAPALKAAYPGVTFRLGIFFLIHAALATWAAISWSTEAWAFLKGVGFTLSFMAYFGVEFFFLRRSARRGLG